MKRGEVMKWEKYLETEGSVVGNRVYIVDIRMSDGNAYIRHVEPTLVEITNNSELPKGKNIYYSNYHFRKVGKKGNVLKQIIAPFDNTGYRAYTGVSVYVFNTYEEAVDKYNSQLDEVIKVFEGRKKEIGRAHV